MVPWLIYQGWVVPQTMETDRRGAGVISLASASITVMVIGLYFVNYQTFKTAPAERYVEPGLLVYATTALKYLASGFGGGSHDSLVEVPWLPRLSDLVDDRILLDCGDCSLPVDR